MANEEHLKILRQGVEVWNQWRDDNPEIMPDLYGANLTGVDLTEVNLNRAKLFKADLTYASLSRAKLLDAYLSWADLSWADLSEANISNAKLSGAKLTGANLHWAVLTGANLSGAELIGANLMRANLIGTNLQEVSLYAARLIGANLTKATLTGVYLWETQRAKWSIKNVFCEYVYWDEAGKEKTKYAPGEFERLFANQSKIRLFYKNGISLAEIATLPALIQHLEGMQGCSLRFVSINEGTGAVVELAIEDTENLNNEQIKQLQASLEVEAQRQVEYQKQVLIERTMRLQLEKQLYSFVDKLILRQGGIYNISGQAGAVGPNAHTHDTTFNQLVNQSIDLSALAKELSELRQAIKDKQDSSPQADIALVKVAEAEIAATEKDTAKVVEHLKVAGKWTMDFAREIGKDVVVAAIKQVMGIA